MNRLSVATGLRRFHWRHVIIGSVALALGWVLYAAGAGRTFAEEPEVPGPSSSASPSVDPVEPVDSASEEIWISSDNPAAAAVAAPGPQSAPARPAGPPLASRLTVLTSPDQAGGSSGETLSRPQHTLSERLKAAQRDLLKDLKQARAGIAAPVTEDDSALFHTTSGPAKPAASVFRPLADCKRAETGSSSPVEFGGRWQHSWSPPVQPEIQVPPTAGLPAIDLRVRGPREEGFASSGVRGKPPGQQAVVAQADKPREVPLSASVLRGKAPPRQSPLGAPAPRAPQVAMKKSPVRGNEPLTTGRTRTEPVVPPQPRGPQSTLSAARSAGKGSRPSPQKVVLRVSVAELDHARAGKGSVLGLRLSPRSPLLRTLLKAESGTQPILLDFIEREDLASQMGALEEQGLLRIRSQPTLVTASGRQAKLLTVGGQARFTSASEGGPPTERTDLPAGITLRPVVTGDDYVQLEVTAGPAPGLSTEQPAAPTAQVGGGTVRMRAGQTVAIRGLGVIPPEGDNHQQQASLAKVLGLGKKKPRQSELVLFVTPEWNRPAPAVATASPLGDDATDDEKAPSWLSNLIGRPKGQMKPVRQASLSDRPTRGGSSRTR